MRDHKQTTTAIIIPSYKELAALPDFLNELTPLLSNSTALVIADDSPQEIFSELEHKVLSDEKLNSIQIIFTHSAGKGGRGAAVKRGFAAATKAFPNLAHVLECDADGSHLPIDVVNVLKHNPAFDMVIGSRYVSGSKISNWPRSRMLFSKILNLIIPKMLGLEIHDVTNGLRRYSIGCVKEIMAVESINSGFIYLSEQALIVTRNRYSIREVPIHFVNRVLGESTVTIREILKSISGIFSLLPYRIRRK